jgi:hypothetical protein
VRFGGGGGGASARARFVMSSRGKRNLQMPIHKGIDQTLVMPPSPKTARKEIDCLWRRVRMQRSLFEHSDESFPLILYTFSFQFGAHETAYMKKALQCKVAYLLVSLSCHHGQNVPTQPGAHRHAAFENTPKPWS